MQYLIRSFVNVLLEHIVRLSKGMWLFALFLLVYKSFLKLPVFQWRLCSADHNVNMLVVDTDLGYQEVGSLLCLQL